MGGIRISISSLVAFDWRAWSAFLHSTLFCCRLPLPPIRNGNHIGITWDLIHSWSTYIGGILGDGSLPMQGDLEGQFLFHVTTCFTPRTRKITNVGWKPVRVSIFRVQSYENKNCQFRFKGREGTILCNFLFERKVAKSLRPFLNTELTEETKSFRGEHQRCGT